MIILTIFFKDVEHILQLKYLGDPEGILFNLRQKYPSQG